jgi:hypothetical protein
MDFTASWNHCLSLVAENQPVLAPLIGKKKKKRLQKLTSSEMVEGRIQRLRNLGGILESYHV